MGRIYIFLSNDVRGGKASAANLGLRYATGKFIIHMDADCSYDRDAVENIIVPFYYDDKLGAVGGDVQVRNYRESLCATLQAIEYTDTISVGRISQSQLGIYRIISAQFPVHLKKKHFKALAVGILVRDLMAISRLKFVSSVTRYTLNLQPFAKQMFRQHSNH